MLTALIAAALLSGSGPAAPVSDIQCPTVSPEAATALAHKLKTRNTSGDFALNRERGESVCSGYDETRTCAINDPGLIQARFRADTAYFSIPAGRKALLDVKGGKLRCSLAN